MAETTGLGWAPQESGDQGLAVHTWVWERSLKQGHPVSCLFTPFYISQLLTGPLGCSEAGHLSVVVCHLLSARHFASVSPSVTWECGTRLAGGWHLGSTEGASPGQRGEEGGREKLGISWLCPHSPLSRATDVTWFHRLGFCHTVLFRKKNAF